MVVGKVKNVVSTETYDMGIWSTIVSCQTFPCPILPAPLPSYSGLLLLISDLMTVWIWMYSSCDGPLCIVAWCPPSGPMVREQWHSRNYFSAMTVSLLQVAGPFFRTQDMNDITFLSDLQKTLHTTVLYYEYQKYTWSPCKGRSGWVKDINGLMEVMNGMVVKSLEGGCYDSCVGAYRDST